jgi:cytochrome c oxidase assembly protein subunit 15
VSAEGRAARFLRLAVLSATALYLVVATGAVVRLTASGLGCDNWPRCGNTPFPETGGHALIEFSNRVLALAAILCTLAAWLAARRVPGLPRWARLTALAVFLGAVAQIPLGGLTVIFNLHPLLVMAHFLLALVVLGAAVVVALEAWGNAAGRAAGPLASPRWRWAAAALVGACLALVVTGTVVTASGPHAGSKDVRRLGVLLDAVYVHVRATAVFGVAFLALLWLAWRLRASSPLLLRAALGLLALLGVQLAVGEIQYRTHLPSWLVLVHVGLAAAVWAWTVGLAAVLWRPPAAVARGE